VDGSSFDHLTKACATISTRRRILGAALGTMAALAASLRSVAAQTCIPEGASCADSDRWCCGGTFCVNGYCRRFVAPGESCRADFECSPSQSSRYYCRENGMAISPACCGFAGAGCGNDTHCCHDFVCRDGTCGSAPVAIYGGVACRSDEQCGWPLLCADNGTYLDAPYHCCLPPGGWCLKQADCCVGSVCVDGYCG